MILHRVRKLYSDITILYKTRHLCPTVVTQIYFGLDLCHSSTLARSFQAGSFQAESCESRNVTNRKIITVLLFCLSENFFCKMTARVSTSFPSGLQHIQNERFAKQHGYQLLYLSMTLSGNIAVSGFNYVTQQTFIDLYFGRNCNSKHKLNLVYSKEFPKHSDYYRFASFLGNNSSQILSCVGDQIEIFDTQNESKVVRSCKVNSRIRCLAFSEGEIFVGSYKSQTVLVFNRDLKETKTITLKGLKESDFPRDLQVIKETVFVCTGYGRALSVGVLDGSILAEYRDTTRKYKRARSITVSERLGLVAVLWGMQRIILYFLSKNKACLFFDVDFGVHRIIISDRDRMMITGNIGTGEIKMCNMEQLFSFEALKKTLANIVLPNECEELRKYFGVTEEEISRKEEKDNDKSEKLHEKETVKRVESLLNILEEKGYVDAYDIRLLMDAVATTSHGTRNLTLQGPMEGYALYGILSLKVKYEALLMELMSKQKDWDAERYQLSAELTAAKTQGNENQKRDKVQDDELRRRQNQFTEHDQTLTNQLEQTKQLSNLNRTESAEKIETLTRELKISKNSPTSNGAESDELIILLREELDKTKRESFHKIKTLTEELSESVKHIESLTKQLDQTKQSLDLTKRESSRQIKDLTLKLERTLQKLNTHIKEKGTIVGSMETTKQVVEKATRVVNRSAEAITEPEKGTTEQTYLVDSDRARDKDSSICAGSKTYEDIVMNVSSSLDTEQCKELASYFRLTLEDTDMITANQNPGKMLMKTLEEKAPIDSQKMTILFEGLKACHLDKTANLVLECINEISKGTQEELKQDEAKNIKGTEESVPLSRHLVKKGQKNDHSALSDQSVQTIVSSSCVSSDDHVTTLTKEGYTEQDVVGALDISKNRLELARKVLLLLGEKLDVLTKEDSIYLYKEQYIDENGGNLDLQEANAQIVIPAGAVSQGSIVSLTMMTSKQDNVSSEGNTLRLTPVIKCGQEGLSLNKPITVRIPHCASEIGGITSTNMNLGFSNNGDVGIHWRKRKQNEPTPIPKGNHLEVLIQSLCAVSLDIAADFDKPLTKRFRVLPLIKKVVDPSDDLIVTVWIYNDDETEHVNLLHQEINVGGKIQLHDFKRFTIKGLEDDKEVHIRRVNNNITPYPNASMKKVLSSTMWNSTRQSVDFNFQRKEGISDISFKIRLCKKQFLRSLDDLQFDVKVTLSELLEQHQPSTRAIFKKQKPAAVTVSSFDEMVDRLSGQLDMDSCLEIARLFGLNPGIRAGMKKCREPGKFLFEELKNEHLLTPDCVSALDVVLTNTGNEQLAKHVKEYRKRNASFPTTIFRLL